MLFLIVVLTGATGLFYYAAATRNHGSAWVDQLCTQSVVLCDQPRVLLLALCVVVIFGAYKTMTGRA